MTAAGLTPTSDVNAAAGRYDGETLRAEEVRRDEERQARVRELSQRFVDGPQLIVPRGQGAMTLTTGATPIPDEGIVIFGYQLSAEWGELDSSGILESDDGVTLRLPLPFDTSGRTLTGDGWTIELAAGWTTEPASRPGDLRLVEDAR